MGFLDSLCLEKVNYLDISFYIYIFIFLIVQNKNNSKILQESWGAQYIPVDVKEMSHPEIWIFIVVNGTEHITLTYRFLFLRIITKFSVLFILHFRKCFVVLCQDLLMHNI